MYQAIRSLPTLQQILSSPLDRCACFAAKMAHQGQIPFACDNRLAEIHFGDWEGCSVEELMITDPQGLSCFWREPQRYTPPNAESLTQFQRRVVAAWCDCIGIQKGPNVLVVTHAGVMRILLCYLQNRAIDELLDIDIPYAALFHLQMSQRPTGNRVPSHWRITQVTAYPPSGSKC